MGLSHNIRAAIRARVITVAGIPPAERREWENVGFDRPTGLSWMRDSMKPVDRALKSMPAEGGKIRDIGLYLFDVFVPLGADTVEAETIADAIVDSFKPGLQLSNGGRLVTIDYSKRRGGENDPPNWYFVPVEIKYRVDTINA